MTAIVHTKNLTKAFGRMQAVHDVSFTIEEGTMCGLLGRNGAGKTTLMRVLAAATPATSGEAQVFGAPPWENPEVLARMCFVREDQDYPEAWIAGGAMTAASLFYPGWDAALADHLADLFDLPLTRKISKLSRGQKSALGVSIALASRAPLTIFDEPYLGLDPVARRVFYDALLEDYSAHPRTVIVSTHLIDEIAHLLTHVLVIDRGRIVIDSDVESLRGASEMVEGPAGAVAAFSTHYRMTTIQQIGAFARATLAHPLDDAGRQAAAEAGLSVSAKSLQQLVIDTVIAHSGAKAQSGWEESR
jgi:ABC-2 type transport system ATP-binding protein